MAVKRLGHRCITMGSHSGKGEKRGQYYLTAYWGGSAALRPPLAHEKRGTPPAGGRAPLSCGYGTNVKRIIHICKRVMTFVKSRHYKRKLRRLQR